MTFVAYGPRAKHVLFRVSEVEYTNVSVLFSWLQIQQLKQPAGNPLRAEDKPVPAYVMLSLSSAEDIKTEFHDLPIRNGCVTFRVETIDYTNILVGEKF